MQVDMLCGGYVALDAALMLPDRDPGSLWTVPVSACLGVHARGRLLFDTGIPPRGDHGSSVTTRPSGRSCPGRRSRWRSADVTPERSAAQ